MPTKMAYSALKKKVRRMKQCMVTALPSWKRLQDQRGPKTPVSSKHSYNNFTFQVFKTSWENKGNPGRAARDRLDKAISFSIWTEEHLVKKTKAIKIHPTTRESPIWSWGEGEESCFTAVVSSWCSQLRESPRSPVDSPVPGGSGGASKTLSSGQAAPAPLLV